MEAINPFVVIGTALIALMIVPASLGIAYVVSRVIATWDQKL